MSQSRNTKTTLAAIKLAIFVLVSLIVTGTLTAIMGSFAFGSETEYKADFTSASLVKKGDDVRIAGVTVGSVKGVEIKDRDKAEVTFKVKSDVPVTTATRASIRFLNLVGARYMSLEEGQPGRAAARQGGDHPDLADHPGAEPHRAVQRLPAAVPGADPERGQPALAEPRQGAPGRGRHHRQPDAEHGLAHQRAGRPRRAHRARDRQPLVDAPDRRRPARAAQRARRRAQGLDDQPLPRPQGDRRVRGQPLRPHRRGGRASSRRAGPTSRPTSPSCDA